MSGGFVFPFFFQQFPHSFSLQLSLFSICSFYFFLFRFFFFNNYFHPSLSGPLPLPRQCSTHQHVVIFFRIIFANFLKVFALVTSTPLCSSISLSSSCYHFKQIYKFCNFEWNCCFSLFVSIYKP